MKITIIGGGSSYTPEIIEGFILRAHELPIHEICLVDIPEGQEKLRIIKELTERMVGKANVPFEVTSTLNRIEGLTGADFVVTQLRVGQIDARIHDENIAFKHGILGQETNGIVGFAKAMRTIPVILDIAKDMEEVCPDAWLINFTNPAGIITETLLKHTKIRALGVCNVPVNMRKTIEKSLGSDDFIFHAIGLNHYVWGKHVYYKGKDCLPDLLPTLLEDESFNPKNIGHATYHTKQICQTGLMPCYYHAYYYSQKDMYEHAYASFLEEGSRGEVVKKVEDDLFKLYQSKYLNTKPTQLEQRGGAYYSDAACDVISAIYNNKHSLMVVNTQNNGTLSFLPDDAAIEATCLISSSGAHPLSVSKLPFFAQAELTLIKAYEGLVIEAAIESHYEKALQALSIHPLIPSGSHLESLLNEVLPHFKKK